MSESPYTLDQLESALGYLASYIQIMQEYELLFKDTSFTDPDHLMRAGKWIEEVVDRINIFKQEASITGNGDLSRLGGVPDRCRSIIEIEHEVFEAFAEETESLGESLVSLEGNPGNILTRVTTIWYGSAADAFENHFSEYPGVIERQLEMFGAMKNGSIGLGELSIAGKAAIRDTVESANQLAQEIIGHYEQHMELVAEQKLLQIAVVIAVSGSLVGASGAAGASAAGVSGSATLASYTLAIGRSEKTLAANDSNSLLDAVHDALTSIESGIDEGDTLIYDELDGILNSYRLREFAIQEPPGADGIDKDDFYYGK